MDRRARPAIRSGAGAVLARLGPKRREPHWVLAGRLARSGCSHVFGRAILGCGFPGAKILALFHAGTGVQFKVMITPLRSHEMASVCGIHPALKAGDVLVDDRGFCSFADLAMWTRDGVYAIIRMHQQKVVNFTPNRPHARTCKNRAANGLPRSALTP